MKKIAMFPGEVSAEYQAHVCEAASAECEKLGIQLTIFHNFSVYGSNVFHSYGERSVIYIPNIKSYDGFIVLPNALGVEGMRGELLALLRKEAEGKPVICLKEEIEGFYNILLDDYSAMRHMVEHLIDVHGLTKISFMKGRADFEDAKIRFRAYQDVMQEHHLEITDHMVFDGDYWKLKGDEAVNWFWDTAEEKPQAIVCANDFMAISVQEALQKRGVKIPDVVKVTGFDDSEEARYTSPAISSMRVDYGQIISKAMEMLQNVWSGRPQKMVEVVTATGNFRESCGCHQEVDVRKQSELFQSKEVLQNILQQTTLMYIDCDNVNTLEDLLRLAAYYMHAGDSRETVYFCLCDEEEKQKEKAEMAGKYTEYMELRAVMSPHHTEFCKERFRREQILPEKYLKECVPLYVNPFHDKNECLGYFVVTPGFSSGMSLFYQLWIQAITNSLLRQRTYDEGRQLAETIDQYNFDELTGVHNRRKLDFVLKNADAQLQRKGKSYYIVNIDMDGLKHINDTYGHVVGDEALCTLANILRQMVGENDIVARTGGDEFIICYRTEDDELVKSRIQGIRDAIEKYNREGGKEYELSASIGYAKCEKDMMPINCIQMADEMMYLEKRGKKGKARAE